MKSLPNIKPSAVRRLADWLLSAPDNTEASRLASPSTPTAPELCDADTSDRPKPTFTLTGAQLLEALDLVAPDRTVDQLECEASFQYGDGHDGKGMYCWITEYPEEGATKLDSSIAQPIAASVATLVMQPLTDAAMREALDEFELICENNDVRRLTDAEKYAAQEFALSLVHADPSGAPVAEPTCKHIATWADGKCTDCGAKVVSDDELTQRALADRDIDLFGQAFMIDGKRIDPERVSILSKHAVAADGAPSDDLLQLDVLLANLHAAVWHAGAGDDGPVDYDMAGKDEAKAIQRHVRAMLAERAAVSPATADTPLNGIAATMFHGEGAIARCSYCGRYSLDPKTLGDRQPKCECGEKDGWSGSFEKPRPDANWSGAAPASAREPSPTAGMNLGERIKHVGGRENAAGYIEFGSVTAVDALIKQVIRDLPRPSPSDAIDTALLREALDDQCAFQAEIDRLRKIINTPQSGNFLRAVSIEAEHQRQRWSSEHDSGKTPADWFWLVGYLAGKALTAANAGNVEKAEHHVITTAAALANWHLAIFGKTDMRPGTEQPEVQGAQGGTGGEA
ncbi:hypothetical protein [Burkholderia gladioli]|uniref:hypothetical protein n=1 Tax=Burkholderia gladioli TaxID=28095 RepID=UPI001ABAB563|nr:hypothetical protein [Burkholderia gladioli]